MRLKKDNNFTDIRRLIGGQEIALLERLNIEVGSKPNEGTPCPACQGKDRFSWCTKEEQWLYNCRHCGGGDLFNLITKLHHDDPKKAAQAIKQAVGHLSNIVPKPQPQTKPAKVQPQAQQLMQTVTQRHDHPYLEKKGLSGIEVNALTTEYHNNKFKYAKGSIVVPISNGLELISLQFIDEAGNKQFLAGCSPAGGFYLLEGTQPTKYFIVEGYATGLSIYHAFDRHESVVIGFNTGNLKKVAAYFRQVNTLPLIFMADHDANQAGEKAAHQAALHEPIFMPPDVGNDWDDYRQQGHDIKTEVLRLEQAYMDTNKRELNFTDLNETGKPLATHSNLVDLLNYLEIKAIHNAMNLEIELMKNNIILPKTDEQKRSMLISEALKAGISKTTIEDHLVAVSETETYHPVKAWLGNNKWDQVPRVQKLINILKTKNPEATSLILNKWLVGCVAALYEPHFNLKLVPVLQGEQSYMKTTFISRLASVLEGAFLEGAELNPDNKDSILSCIRSWIVELGELERTSKNSQGSLKAFITKSVDTVRPPYGRGDIKKKRQTTFIATVNGTDFLRDETGSSRYGVIELIAPIDMEQVNQLLGWSYNGSQIRLVELERLKQFWLEVRYLYEQGASWHLTPEEQKILTSINSHYTFKTSIREEIEQILASAGDNPTYKWFLARSFCLQHNIPTAKVREVGRILNNLAKEKIIEVRTGRSNTKEYRIPMNPTHC